MLARKVLVSIALLALGVVARAQPVARYMYEGDTNKNPIPVCKDYQATFNNISIGIWSSIQWNFQGGNPATSTADNPIVTWNTPGTKNCSFTVYQGTYSNTINFQVVVSTAQTTPSFGFIPDVCSSDPAFMLTQGSPPGGEYFGLGVAIGHQVLGGNIHLLGDFADGTHFRFPRYLDIRLHRLLHLLLLEQSL